MTRKQHIERERIEREREIARIEHQRNAMWIITQSQRDIARSMFDATYAQCIAQRDQINARSRDIAQRAHVERIAYIERMFTSSHHQFEYIIDVGDDYVCVRVRNDQERMYSYVIDDDDVITFKKL